MSTCIYLHSLCRHFIHTSRDYLFTTLSGSRVSYWVNSSIKIMPLCESTFIKLVWGIMNVGTFEGVYRSKLWRNNGLILILISQSSLVFETSYCSYSICFELVPLWEMNPLQILRQSFIKAGQEREIIRLLSICMTSV